MVCGYVFTALTTCERAIIAIWLKALKVNLSYLVQTPLRA